MIAIYCGSYREIHYLYDLLLHLDFELSALKIVAIFSINVVILPFSLHE